MIASSLFNSDVNFNFNFIPLLETSCGRFWSAHCPKTTYWMNFKRFTFWGHPYLANAVRQRDAIFCALSWYDSIIKWYSIRLCCWVKFDVYTFIIQNCLTEYEYCSALLKVKCRLFSCSLWLCTYISHTVFDVSPGPTWEQMFFSN